MSLEVSIDTEKRRVRTAWVGRIDGPDLLEADAAFRSTPDVEPDFDQLIDLRRTEPGDVTTDAISSLASRPPFFSKSSRRAVVVRSDLGFGLSRMFEQMRGDAAGEIRVFRDVESAEAWLDGRG